MICFGRLGVYLGLLGGRLAADSLGDSVDGDAELAWGIKDAREIVRGDTRMLMKRITSRAVALLDWSWPFPLGLFFGVVVFSVLAAAWLVFWQPTTPQRPAPQASRRTVADIPAAGSSPAPVATSSDSQPASNVETQARDAVATPSSASPFAGLEASRSSGHAPSSLTSATVVQASGTREAVTGVEPRPAAHPPAPKPAGASVTPPTPSAPQLSPRQKAEINDKLTLGSFFLERREYREALREFQAVLTLDPSNRDARNGVAQAEEGLKSSSQ